MKESPNGYWGIAISLLLALVFAFATSKHLWFDMLQPNDKAIFWTNLAVATGTICLAAVTYWNVKQTKNVIAGEDRRHQQSFMPVLESETILHSTSEGRAVMFTIRNVGKGPALGVSLEIAGAVHYTYESYASSGGEPVLSSTGNRVREKRTGELPLHHILMGSTIGDRLGSENLFAPDVFPADAITAVTIDQEKSKLSLFIINYFDVFGNQYESRYLDFKKGIYQFVQPSHLDIPG